MPKIDLEPVEQVNRTGYPSPYDAPVAGRWYRRLAPAAGLTRLGASHVVLKPGAWSSQRHWHAGEDEFLVILAGQAVLVDDWGEHILRAGDCAAFPMAEENGHHLQNRGDEDCVFVVVSAGSKTAGDYPDIDMSFTAGGSYVRKDGTPYAAKKAT
jgi:uncharacterized cupin superfamily protein